MGTAEITIILGVATLILAVVGSYLGMNKTVKEEVGGLRVEVRTVASQVSDLRAEVVTKVDESDCRDRHDLLLRQGTKLERVK